MGRPISIKQSLENLDEVRDVAQASIPVVTEAEYAAHQREKGWRIRRHRGRFWRQITPGFYQPVHALAMLTASQATRPSLACWGYQACLLEGEVRHANAVAPVYLISNLGDFDEEALPSSRRYKLRKARRRTRLVQLTGSTLLREQGYDVLRSAHSRTGYGRLPSRKAYLAALDRIGHPAGGIVLAGLADGRLTAYVTGFAVDGTAYVDNVVIAAEGLNSHVGTGLTYEFIQACHRSPGIERVMHGRHAPEDEGLCRYKEWFGLPIQHVPSRIGLLPGMAPAIRWRNPYKYYRLTGSAPGRRPAARPGSTPAASG